MMGAATRHIIQGEYAVERDPEAVISTVLGSCVACCLRDPGAGLGGMNHFLLPGDEDSPADLKYGAHAMELLINGLLGLGARRERLEAKLFGGARMLRGVSDIGSQNAAFAERFLHDEGIEHTGGSLGGNQARRIQFWPASGRVRQRQLEAASQVFATERAPALATYAATGDVDLF